MMDFGQPRLHFDNPRPRRAMRETTVPMINVVFLLLVFLLMTAQIAPPVPLDVTVPVAADMAAPEAGPAELVMGADGVLAFGAFRGEAALAAAAAAAASGALTLRADAAAPGAELADVLARLAALGLAEARLVTGPRR